MGLEPREARACGDGLGRRRRLALDDHQSASSISRWRGAGGAAACASAAPGAGPAPRAAAPAARRSGRAWRCGRPGPRRTAVGRARSVPRGGGARQPLGHRTAAAAGEWWARMNARPRSARARASWDPRHLAHEPRGVVEVGLGPVAVGGVGLVAGADRHELVVDEKPVARRCNRGCRSRPWRSRACRAASPRPGSARSPRSGAARRSSRSWRPARRAGRRRGTRRSVDVGAAADRLAQPPRARPDGARR